MPKKRFPTQYSKPPSTAHSSLGSANAAIKEQDVAPTVNGLLSKLRLESNKPTPANPAPAATNTPTVPPTVGHLLSLPAYPIPRNRQRRGGLDASGRRLPSGPAPPVSWLSKSRWAPKRVAHDTRLTLPYDVTALPGQSDEILQGNKLHHMALRALAKNWEYMQVYEQNNLASLPTQFRMALLSTIAVHGPGEGVGREGLVKLLVYPPHVEGSDGVSRLDYNGNKDFTRLDLSGAIGPLLTFKDLDKLFQPNDPSASALDTNWDDDTPGSSSATLQNVTSLSLSHPHLRFATWPKLLDFSSHLGTLTQLSLAFWPLPSNTPNAVTTTMSPNVGREVQYGASNYYTQAVDLDFTEAADLLRRLAKRLYSLEYLDLTGCSSWWVALRSTTCSPEDDGVLQWGTHWPRLRVIVLRSGRQLHESSEHHEVFEFCKAYQEALWCDTWLRGRMRMNKQLELRSTQIEVIMDDPGNYDTLWRDESSRQEAGREGLASQAEKSECIRRNRQAMDDVLKLKGLWRREGGIEHRFASDHHRHRQHVLIRRARDQDLGSALLDDHETDIGDWR